MTNLLHQVVPDRDRKLIFVHPDVSAANCCEIMAKHNIGALLVTDDENVYGLVSERDIVRRLMCKNLNPNTTTAQEIAFADVSILSFQDSVEKAMEVMTKTRRRHVLIEENGKIVSIVSIGDLLIFLLEDQSRVIDQLERYISS